MLRRFPRLRERLQQRAGLLSGGEQQMLAMARGLMASRACCCSTSRRWAWRRRSSPSCSRRSTRCAAKRMTIVLVDQMAALALALADRAYVIEGGRIVAQGSGGDRRGRCVGAGLPGAASWMWALGIGMGLASALPSLWWRKPVMIAWSTPGAAVLAVAGMGYSMNEAVGAFIVCAVLMVLAGATGWFERVMNRIPMAIASALLAGVLARFGLGAFIAAQTALPLVLLMLGTYLVTKRLLPRYAVPLTLGVAIVYVAARGQLAWSAVHFTLTWPVFTMPVFSWQHPLRGRPARGLQDLQGHHLLDDARGAAARPSHRRLRAAPPGLALGRTGARQVREIR
jgi:hypothetical protein